MRIVKNYVATNYIRVSAVVGAEKQNKNIETSRTKTKTSQLPRLTNSFIAIFVVRVEHAKYKTNMYVNVYIKTPFWSNYWS